ncbi:hypothetical protein [uncultured Corynebacterium sp.]|uniref:Rv2732c family membrane protein n=1 Tax=uncultured Corynebacterium sp. TaxID=159447 RepID=UPI0025D5B7E3|nr:hypothetical protein [uncultured Corynebacterium sp.]
MTEESSTTAAQKAATAERRAAQTMELGGHRVTLCIAVVAYLLYLILPYAGPADGWEALTFGTTSSGVRISIMETVSAWLALIGLGILTPVTILTRRATSGLVAWMLVTVSFFANLWGFWFRGSTADGASLGMWVGMLATFLAFLAYSMVALRRSPEQKAAEAQVRATAGQLDEVGEFQSSLDDTPRQEPIEDTRRKQAAERHRAQRGE